MIEVICLLSSPFDDVPASSRQDSATGYVFPSFVTLTTTFSELKLRSATTIVAVRFASKYATPLPDAVSALLLLYDTVITGAVLSIPKT